MSFLNFTLIDAIDIFLVAILLYQLYKLVRGTVAINIFIAITSIYLLWKLVDAFNMELLSEILGQFIGVGVIILVIVFQQELRKFLIIIGRTKIIRNKRFFKLNVTDDSTDVDSICKACQDFSKNKTGSILVITRMDDLTSYSDSGVTLKAKITLPLLKSIFFKNSPLHDGAVIIKENIIVAARCVLPITNNSEFPQELGMRHRASVGISEDTDAIVIVVSEQSGEISFVKEGNLIRNCSDAEIKKLITKELENKVTD